MNIFLDGSALGAPTSMAMPAGASRWIKFSIWAFVIIMVVSVVVPLACSFLGVFGAMAGAFLLFFRHWTGAALVIEHTRSNVVT